MLDKTLINDVFIQSVNALSIPSSYEEWDNEFIVKHIKLYWENTIEKLKRSIDITNLTESECAFLGFKKYQTKKTFEEKELPYIKNDFENGRLTQEEYNAEVENGYKACKIMLFPFYMYDIIPDDTEVINIFGEVKKFKHGKTNNDIRFGCLSYGIIPKTDD